MAKSGRHINWSAVGFTPTAGTLTPMTRIQTVQIADRGQAVTGSADADFFPTLKKVVGGDPMVTVSSEDGTLQSALPKGTTGVWTGTHNDAVNGTGSGAIVYTLAGAVITDVNRGGGHQQLGSIDFQIEAASPDGITNPLSLSVTP